MSILPPVGEGQIRLLRIIHAGPKVECDIQVFGLANLPNDGYFALSYCWGTGGQSMHVTVRNSGQLNVSPTLFGALRELHRRDEIQGAWHWIDQICIDQASLAEKAQQVKAMDKVYGLAKRVLVWLGGASADSEIAMDNLDQLISQMGDRLPSNYNEQLAIQARLPPRGHPVWKAIVSLYSRPWFRRVWIVQEAVLANGSFVLCGNRTLSWSKIVQFANKIMAIWPAVLESAGQPTHDDYVSGLVSCSQMARLLEMRDSQDISLLNILLTTTRDREASLPIDHIYGIASLVPIAYRGLIKVDYELPYERAVLLFCKEYIRVDSTLNLLGMAASQDRPVGLPSWCPHFGSPPLDQSKIYTYIGCMAGFDNTKPRVSNIMISDIDDSIVVSGFRIDTVGRVAERSHNAAESGLTVAAEAANCLEWMEECEALCTAVLDQGAETIQWEAYSRTLIAGHFSAVEPVPNDTRLYDIYVNFKKYTMGLASSAKSMFDSAEEQNMVLRYGVGLALQESRKFFITKHGRIGLGPSNLQINDVVVVFNSGACVWALRFDGTGDKATLVGDAFMPGFMNLRNTPAHIRANNERFAII